MASTSVRSSGVRSGRAVVSLDVVSHTLPRRNHRPTTTTYQPICCRPDSITPHHRPQPPTSRNPSHPKSSTASNHPRSQSSTVTPTRRPPHLHQAHSLPTTDICNEPGCAGCEPIMCPGEGKCPSLAPYPPIHMYPPGRDMRGWSNSNREIGGECETCSLLAAPVPAAGMSCTCSDPFCPVAAVPTCCCGCEQIPRPAHQYAHIEQDLQVPQTSSDRTLPKLACGEGSPQFRFHNDAHVTTHHHPHVPVRMAAQRPPRHHHSFGHGRSHGHSQGLGLPSVGSRLSRSLEDLPRDIKEHILKCQCSCDHLGYGNFSATSLHQLPGLSNGCSSLSTKTNSREDLSQEVTEIRQKHRGGEVPAQVWGGVCLVLVVAGVAGVGVSVPLALKVDPSAGLKERLATASELLRDTPLIDGHNDLPWNIRKFMHNKLHSFNFTTELKTLRPWSRSSWSHTDLPRLKEGMVGAQFWASYVPCGAQKLNAVQLTIEQVDLIKRLIDQYPDDLRLATSADEVEAAFKEGRIASLIGVEGGHAIQNSLGVLRALRDLGVRYLTLTHTCSTPWAESARAKETDLEDPDSPRGLTHFGKTVVREMNRLGLLVDLSHVSQATMKAALEVSRAPVIFSHSSVYAICKNPRNVPDEILRKVALNGGIVMVSFYNHFLTCSQEASVKDVVGHINHVRKVAGVLHVGIGADFDGVNKLPLGLEDVSRYPHLFAELLSDPSWTYEDLKKLAGQNLLRVMRNVEKVRVQMSRHRTPPFEEEVPPAQLKDHADCSYKFTKTIEEQ